MKKLLIILGLIAFAALPFLAQTTYDIKKDSVTAWKVRAGKKGTDLVSWFEMQNYINNIASYQTLVSNTGATVSRLTTLSATLGDKLTTGTITTQNLNPTGAPTANSTVSLSLIASGTSVIYISGTYTGALTIQYSMDAITWTSSTDTQFIKYLSNGAFNTNITSGANGFFKINTSGLPFIRISANSAVTGSAIVAILASLTNDNVSINAPLPTGGNTIGNVNAITAGVTPGSGATNLGKAEDAVHASSDIGVFSLGVHYSSLTSPAAAGDYVFSAHDDLSKQIVMPYTHLTNAKNACTSAITTTTSTQAFAAAGAGVRTYVTSISIVNEGATGTAVSILDGSTIIWKGYVTATSGYNDVQFPTPLKGTANTALNVQCVTAGGSVTACLTAFNAL